MRGVHRDSITYNSKISDDVEVREFCSIRDSEIGISCIIFERVSIKKSILRGGVKVNAGSYVENAMIYNDVQISPNCTIVGVGHDFTEKGVSKKDVFSKIIIRSNSWIGAGSIINPGVKIGINSIVASGSLVAINVPDNSIYLGTPGNLKIYSLKDWENKKNKS